VRMFNAWGGSVPKLVPDNLKTGVTHASFYDPVFVSGQTKSHQLAELLPWNWKATCPAPVRALQRAA
jgi:hypothetical protein